MPERIQSVFELFPGWVIYVGLLVEFAISILFVGAWAWSIRLALEARRDGKRMAAAVERLVAWIYQPAGAEQPADGTGSDRRIDAAELGAAREEIEERLERRRRKEGVKSGP